MDHLPLPSNPTFPYPRIPYLCGHLDDCPDFLLYPGLYADQHGVGRHRGASAGIWLLKAAQELPDGTATIEIFLQRWIFFGLLNEFLGPIDSFSKEDYLGTDRLGQYVHTKGIKKKVKEWSNALRDWNTDQKQVLSDRLYLCVAQATMALYTFYETKKALSPSYDIKISLFVIVELVSEAAYQNLPRPSSGDLWPTGGQLTVSNDSTTAQMLENGWCASEITASFNKCRPVSGRLYMQRMQKPSLGLDHSRCTKDDCENSQIKVSDYEPLHTDEFCTCALLGPNSSAVADCLDDNTVPLLRVTDDGRGVGQLKLEVVPFYEGAPYVALSHVWADGLGNPDATELPGCQISRLQGLIRDLKGKTFRFGTDGKEYTEERELLLWCDSLCCPTVPPENPSDRASHLKQKAISKLRDVYQNATYVLVLDRTLSMSRSSDMNRLEQALRLVTSRWTRRLWTFQECALAPKVLVQFADQALDFRDIWAGLKEQSGNGGEHPRFFSQSALAQLTQLRSWLSIQPSEGTRLSQMVEAVRHRRVTQASDEAICIASILDLDPSRIAETTDEMRMPRLWQLLSNTIRGIPPEIIFNTLPRLSVPGYRWAPRSLLQPFSDESFHGVSDHDSPKAVWSPSGLILRTRGWRVALGMPLWGFSHTQDNLSQIASVLSLKHSNGDWYSTQIVRHLHLDKSQNVGEALQDRSKDWYLILNIPEHSTTPYEALLVYTEQTSGGIVHRSAALVGLIPMSPRWQIIHRIADAHASTVRRHVITRAVQLWAFNELLINALLARLPGFLQRRLNPLVQWCIRAVAKVLKGRFEALIMARGRHADAAVEAATAQTNSRAPPVLSTGFVYTHFSGVQGAVLETFDESHEWCVD